MRAAPRHLLILLLLVTCFACSIEERIERREDRVTGSWRIDRATFKDDDDLFRDNIIDEFRGDAVTFYPDYTLLYRTGTGVVYEGYWAISAIRDLDDETEFTFDADFFDGFGRPAFQWLGTIDKLNSNRFRVVVFERGGTLRLTWEKL